MAQCGATCFSMQWEEFAVKFVGWDGCDSDISDSSADSPRHLPLCAATGLLTQGKGLAEGKACRKTNCSATEIRWMNSGGERRNRAGCATDRIRRRRRLHKAEFAGGQIRQKLKQEGLKAGIGWAGISWAGIRLSRLRDDTTTTTATAMIFLYI